MNADIIDAVRAGLQRQQQAGTDRAWDEAAGRTATNVLADSGWLGVGLATELGGEGGDLADAAAVAAAVSENGWPSPAADIALVTNTVCAAAQLPFRRDTLAVVVPHIATTDDAGRITVDAPRVAWAPWADALIVLSDDGSDHTLVAVVDPNHARLSPGRSLNGAPWARVQIDGASAITSAVVPRPPGVMADAMVGLGALARSVQAAAALGRVQELTLTHIHSRQQFGRALAAFQAVQQNIAILTGTVAAAHAAVADALRGVQNAVDVATDPRLATAKIVTSEAAGEVARIGHQLHGAMGITREHELHRHTLSLWTWREEFGDEHYWARRLAADALAAADVWSWLADEPPPSKGVHPW